MMANLSLSVKSINHSALKIISHFIALACILSLSSCSPKKKESALTTDLIPYNVVKAFPHDPTSFIQGLTIHQGRLFESTGQDNSWISEVDIATGKHDKKIILDKKYFGEGICILNNKLYQLTWQNHKGFVYDLKTFSKLNEFNYDHEGWGITHNGKNLIVSDGTDQLHFLDTLTLKEVSTLTVKDDYASVNDLNELEYIEGYVFANQWQTNYILKIDPNTGKVIGRMEMSPLSEKMNLLNPSADVLNGIAYEQKSKTLLVTGKLWPTLFAIRFQKSAAQ
jgi:glutaminyl-peptide cyclotransferase